MRPIQELAYQKRGEQYLLIKSPPTSGKSRALMFIALDKLANQGLKQAIVVVPERSIGGSLQDEPPRKSRKGPRARTSRSSCPIFEKVQRELVSGLRQTLKYKDNAEVNVGDCFILDGQKVLVAGKGELFTNYYWRPDSRLRVIFDNGTESDLLVRSLQRASNKDKVSRRITESDLVPLSVASPLARGYPALRPQQAAAPKRQQAAAVQESPIPI